MLKTYDLIKSVHTTCCSKTGEEQSHRDLTLTQVRTIIDAYYEVLETALSQGEEVRIPGVGILYSTWSKPRTIKLPPRDGAGETRSIEVDSKLRYRMRTVKPRKKG